MSLASIVVLCLIVGVVRPAAADPGSSFEQVERDKAENRRKQVSSELNELEASDEQLKAELDRLAARVRESEANAGQARTDLVGVERQLVALDAEVKDAEVLAVEARHAAAERAVDAYMRPDRESASQVLAARDPQQLGKMHLLMTHVAEHNVAVVHHREAAELQLRVRVADVEQVRTRAHQLTQAADDDLTEAARLRDRQAVVRLELDKRIVELKDEASQLAAQEANLTALIAQRQAVAVAELVAAPAVTEAPSTTVAPTTPTTPATTAVATTTMAPSTTASPGTPPGVTTTVRATTTVAPTSTLKPGSTVVTTTPVTAPPTTRPSGFGKGSVAWPLVGPVTSGFGIRWGVSHKGIDIGVPSGTPIMAAKGGVVFYSGVMSGYGNVILIDHGGGLVTLYAHQSQLIATNGQSVTQGQTIGLVGSTGHSTGPHLHFEVRINGIAYDPLAYLP